LAQCNALIHTSSEQRATILPLFAQNADKTNRLQHIMRTASAKMVQQGIVRIAKRAASKVVGKIGQGRFIRPSLQQTCKNAKFVALTNRFRNFMQTGVLQTAQRSTVADAKYVCLQELSKINQRRTLQNLSGVPQAQKISYLAFLITPQNASSTLSLTLIWSIFFSFTRSSKDAVLCLESK
jgi:hypothetical protein